MDYADITFEVRDTCALITIDRPERLNAFRGRTVEELIHAFKRTWADSDGAGSPLRGSPTSSRARR